jgi:hypothetical protein
MQCGGARIFSFGADSKPHSKRSAPGGIALSSGAHVLSAERARHARYAAHGMLAAAPTSRGMRSMRLTVCWLLCRTRAACAVCGSRYVGRCAERARHARYAAHGMLAAAPTSRGTRSMQLTACWPLCRLRAACAAARPHSACTKLQFIIELPQRVSLRSANSLKPLRA